MKRAGEFRTDDIFKGDIPFCHFEYIEKMGNELMAALESEKYLVGLEKAAFVERVSHYYCEINMLHPLCAATVLPSAFSLSSWRSMRAIAGLARYRSRPVGGG
jgi:hypothetical protein